jgi:TrkA domain protein
MAEVTETQLPGVGVRHDFTTADGERVGVLTHRSGRREILVYSAIDPDQGMTVLHLSATDTRTLAELLGSSQVSEAVIAVQQQVEGLAIDWINVPAHSRFVGSTIADGRFRTRTGASVIAVLRGATTIPAPEADFVFEAGDVVVGVGTPEGLTELRVLLIS